MVYRQNRSIDVACRVGCQEGDHCGDLFGPGGIACCLLSHEPHSERVTIPTLSFFNHCSGTAKVIPRAGASVGTDDAGTYSRYSREPTGRKMATPACSTIRALFA